MSTGTEHQTIEQVADGVWVGIPAYGEGAIGAVVSGGAGVVVDTTSYEPFAATFLAEVERSAGHAVDWQALLVTHRHYDHFAGAAAIPAPVITHRLTREALDSYDTGWLSRNVANWIEQGMIIPELVGNPISPRPWLTFDDRLTIHLDGGVDVVMIHTGGHTTDESMVYLPKQRLVFGGDNIFHKRTAFTGHGDLLAWISALEEIKRLPIDVVVPGHGPVGGADVIDAQLDDLRRRWAGFIKGDE